MPHSNRRLPFHVDSRRTPEDAPYAQPADRAHAAATAESPQANSPPPPDSPVDSQSTCLPASRTPHGSAQRTAYAAAHPPASFPPARRPSAHRPSSSPLALHRGQPTRFLRWSQSNLRSPHDAAGTRRLKSSSSGNVSLVTAPAPASSSNRQIAGPERSVCSPRQQRSLIVSTTTRTSKDKP